MDTRLYTKKYTENIINKILDEQKFLRDNILNDSSFAPLRPLYPNVSLYEINVNDIINNYTSPLEKYKKQLMLINRKQYDKWIILFPGSFNPIHNGHICLAGDVLAHYEADELWMMPTPQNPLKNKNIYADKWDWYIMVEKTIEYYQKHYGETYKKIKPNYFEFTLKAPFYTTKTIEALQKIYPRYYFSLLIGTDNLATFNKWKKYQWLYDNVHIIAFNRNDGNDIKQMVKEYSKVDIFNYTFYNISSTQLRNNIANDDYSLVPKAIVDYIKEHKLYK